MLIILARIRFWHDFLGRRGSDITAHSRLDHDWIMSKGQHMHPKPHARTCACGKGVWGLGSMCTVTLRAPSSRFGCTAHDQGFFFFFFDRREPAAGERSVSVADRARDRTKWGLNGCTEGASSWLGLFFLFRSALSASLRGSLKPHFVRSL